MKYDESDIKNLIKYLYGLVDYTAPENITTKTVFFYTSDEEKNIFEKNNIFCLDKDCTKDDIQDVFKNKFLSEKTIALYADDLKLYVLLKDLNIDTILFTTNMSLELCESFGLKPELDSFYHFNDNEKQYVLSLFIEMVKQYKYVGISDKFYLCCENNDVSVDDIFINNIKTTKYNIMNIFSEKADQIMSSLKNARLNN
jgi:hypothetical protein